MCTSRVPAEQQYQLIMECRKSGLSDQQWCLNNNIKPGTFYNWVKRLRQKGCMDIPSSNGRSQKNLPQEVVRIDINSSAHNESNNPLSAIDDTKSICTAPSVMELVLVYKHGHEKLNTL